MAEKAGRPVGSLAKPSMSCVPDSMTVHAMITPLINMKQLAAVLGITYGALRALRVKNPDALPKPIRVGGVLRYRATDVDAWIQAQKQVS